MALAVLAVLPLACKKDRPSEPKVIEVKSIALSETELSLTEGQAAKLSATVKPDDATDPTVSWSSSSPAVANVSTGGDVTAVAEGEAVITAKAGGVAATCRVTVLKPYTAVQSLSLNRTAVVLSIGESLGLTATIQPDDATVQSPAWSSDATDIATVSDAGTVTAVAPGTATISAEADGIKATCQITVLPAAPASNRIEYTSMGAVIVSPSDPDAFGAGIVSNTYSDGLGVIEFDGPVTRIGAKAFYQCTYLASVSLPPTVSQIGAEAFSGCGGMTRITLQNGLTTIGDRAFGWCSSLFSITFPDTVSEIGAYAFQSCSALRQITLPEKIQAVGSFAFYECSVLQYFRLTGLEPCSLGSRALNNTANCPIKVPASALAAYKAAPGWIAYTSRIVAAE